MHLPKLLTILFFLSLASIYGADGQPVKRQSTFIYNVNDGLLQSTITGLAVDGNNYCWISFPNGLQYFNGQDFTTVPVQPGLPSDQFIKFFRCADGNLMMSHKMGISLYNWRKNNFTLLYKMPRLLTNPINWIAEYEGTVYALNHQGEVLGIRQNGDVFNWNEKNHIPPLGEIKNTPVSDFFPDEGKAVLLFDQKLVHFNLSQNHYTVHPLPAPASQYLLGMVSPDEALFRFSDSLHQMHLYHFGKKTIEPFFDKPLKTKFLMRAIFCRNGKRTYLAGNKTLMEVDLHNRSMMHHIVTYQNQSIGGGSAISRLCADNYGNLYTATVFTGIRKVMAHSLPIRHFGTETENANFVLSVLPHKKENRILVGTNLHGLYIYDTLQQLQHHFPTVPGSGESFSVNCIIKTKNNDYLLYPSFGKNVWLLRNNLKDFEKLKVIPTAQEDKAGFGFFGKPLRNDDQAIVAQSQGNIYIFRPGEKTVTEFNVSKEYVMSGLLHKGKYIFHENDDLFFLDANSLKETKRTYMPHTGYVRCYALSPQGNIYVGTNKGIFILDEDGKQINLLNKEDGLPDECIYAMVFDDKGFLWCSSNKGIFRVNGDGTYFQLNKEDGLQENEFNTNIAAITNDGEIYFGGVNGVSSFYPDEIFHDSRLPDLMITDIQVNHKKVLHDNGFWNMDKLEVAHNQNVIALSFTTMGPNNPDQYVYQYRILGVNDEWIKQAGQRTVRLFLPPGKYTFQLFASRDFVHEAVPLKELVIVIHPPFWKTWWFISIASVLFLSLLVLAINRYNKRRYQQKLKDLEYRHSLQLQREAISRDLHDNIGAYANAVLYNAGLLEKENDESVRGSLMRSLQLASKDMLLALRETIWAFKKSDYSAQECWLRITNFIQPLSRYYPNIRFSITGNVPEKLVLNHQKAFALVRVVQEAVANSLKHAKPSSITITSTFINAQWRVVISDDGPGFDYEEVMKAATGDGLKNMAKRAERSGFVIKIDSTPGKGTRVDVLV